MKMSYMNDMNEEARLKAIEEREQRIKELKAELAELKCPKTLTSLMNNLMYNVVGGQIRTNSPFVNNDGWEYTRKLCIMLHKRHHRGENMTLNVLSPEEIRISAKMADEIVEIWNKYVLKVYGNDEKR